MVQNKKLVYLPLLAKLKVKTFTVGFVVYWLLLNIPHRIFKSLLLLQNINFCYCFCHIVGTLLH